MGWRAGSVGTTISGLTTTFGMTTTFGVTATWGVAALAARGARATTDCGVCCASDGPEGKPPIDGACAELRDGGFTGLACSGLGASTTPMPCNAGGGGHGVPLRSEAI